MTVLKRRDRIVVFRLTREEYKRLQKACSATGARNLSDFTRSRLLKSAAPGKDRDRIEARLSGVDKRLEELQKSVRQISGLLKQIRDSES